MRNQNALLNEGDKRQHNLGQMTLYLIYKTSNYMSSFILCLIFFTILCLNHFPEIILFCIYLKAGSYRNYFIFLLTN